MLDCSSRLVWSMRQIRKERKENYASSKKLLTSIKEKGPLGKKSPFTSKEKGGSVRIRRVAGRQASRPLLIGLKVGQQIHMPIALRLQLPFPFKTLWWICVSACVRYGGSWIVQILGHTLKNWLLINDKLSCMDGLASQTKQCSGPSPFVA